MTESLKTGTYRVDVTQDDIDQGVRNNSETCAIGRALARATGCRMDIDDAEYIYPTRLKGFKVNAEKAARLRINNFIQNFDAGNPVEPFSFGLEVDIDSDYYDEDYE